MTRHIMMCKKRIFTFLGLFFGFTFVVFAQEVETKISAKSIKIGEELRVEFLVKTPPTSVVVFPKDKTFGRLEVINSYPTDTLQKSDLLQLQKKYGLTQFDSGYYQLPSQKISINNQVYFTDSLVVEIKDVVVDTTQQKMFDIKPILEVEKPAEDFPWGIVLGVLAVIVLAAVLFVLFFKKRKKLKEEKQKLPPFEEAIHHLALLEQSELLDQSEFKKYYSELTNVLKKYLDEEVYANALESTSDELITKLELLRDSGELPLSASTIQELKGVLQTSDLVKFAKSQPNSETAKVDRSTVEQLIKEAKIVLPEPTEDQLLQDQVYLETLEKQKLKRKKITIGLASLGVVVLVFIGFTAKYGFTTVKDTLLGHPTKELLEGNDWIRSEYGNPTIVVSTPQVLKRVSNPNNKTEETSVQTFSYGSITSNFGITINTIQLPPQQMPSSNSDNGNEEENNAIDLEQVNEGSLQLLEQQGAKDILVKQEEYQTSKGLKGMKAYGSLSIENPNSNELQSVEYQILTFQQNTAIQQVLIFYQKSDIYAEHIVQRVLDSIEFKKTEE